jgi:hypothetical protein
MLSHQSTKKFKRCNVKEQALCYPYPAERDAIPESEPILYQLIKLVKTRSLRTHLPLREEAETF